jgi:hypothetical protein
MLLRQPSKLPPAKVLVVALGIDLWVVPALWDSSAVDLFAGIVMYVLVAALLFKLVVRMRSPISSADVSEGLPDPARDRVPRSVTIVRLLLIVVAAAAWAVIGQRWANAAGTGPENSVDLAYPAAFVYWVFTAACIWWVVPVVSTTSRRWRPHFGKE